MTAATERHCRYCRTYTATSTLECLEQGNCTEPLSGLRHVETYRLALLWKNHCLTRKRKSIFLSIFLSLYLSIYSFIYIFKESRITSNYSGINRVPGFAFQHGMGTALSTRLMVGQASISSAVTCCRPRKAALGSAQVWGLARAISHW